MTKKSKGKTFSSLYSVYEGENYSITFNKDESKEFKYQPIFITDRVLGKKANGFYNIFFILI